MNNLKTCKQCKIEKEISAFSFVDKTRRPNLLRLNCNKCRNIENLKRISLKRVVENKERKSHKIYTDEEKRLRVNEFNRLWRINNPEKWKFANRMGRHRRRALGAICSTEWIAKVSMLGNKCQSCFKTEPEIKITIDHIIPVSKGGTNSIDNLQPLCMKCNQKKHAKLPILENKLTI